MKREFWAEFDLYNYLQNNDPAQNCSLIDAWVKNKEEKLVPPFNQIENAIARQILLAEILPSEDKVQFQDKKGKPRHFKAREYARTGALQYERSGGLFYWYYGNSFPSPIGPYQNALTEQLSDFLHPLHLTNEFRSPDLSIFPPGSWFLRLTFTLCKPYISKDDVDFYILDNPVKKEHVFKVPYVTPSQWKGALRAAMVRQLVEEGASLDNEAWVNRRLQLVRLFGNEKGVSVDDERFEVYLDKLRPDVAKTYREQLKAVTPTGFLAGQLHFYPTFFDRIGLEVINPHDRETGAGKHPIYFECVPAGTKGAFTLLYVPLDAGPADENTCQADLEAVAQGIHAMLTTYGFGAKTSSGYGVADVDTDQIEVKPQEWRKVLIKGWEENG